jgi:hypothetical protein
MKIKKILYKDINHKYKELYYNTNQNYLNMHNKVEINSKFDYKLSIDKYKN